MNPYLLRLHTALVQAELAGHVHLVAAFRAMIQLEISK
jgi:hypothetical protein